MPNTEVKPTNAESTWLEAAREDRKLLVKMEGHLLVSFFRVFVQSYSVWLAQKRIAEEAARQILWRRLFYGTGRRTVEMEQFPLLLLCCNPARGRNPRQLRWPSPFPPYGGKGAS